jgi:hypothetical protein
MPSIVRADEKKGIPPLDTDHYVWLGDDGPLLANIATEIFTKLLHDETEVTDKQIIQNCVALAASILLESAMYMNAANEKVNTIMEEHVKKHTLIVRGPSDILMQ